MLKNIVVTPETGEIVVNPVALIAEAEANLSKPGRKTDEERFLRGMTRLQKRQGWFPEDKKTEVVALYVSGVTRVADLERLTHVPASTIQAWRNQDWWLEVSEKIHTTIDQDLVSKQTEIVESALEQIQDRLENGDAVVNKRTGEVTRKPVSMRDATIVANTMTDKRQLLRGKPTSRSEKLTVDDRLSKLAEEFKRFASAKDVTEESKAITHES